MLFKSHSSILGLSDYGVALQRNNFDFLHALGNDEFCLESCSFEHSGRLLAALRMDSILCEIRGPVPADIYPHSRIVVTVFQLIA